MKAGISTLAKLGMLREDFEVFVIEYGRKPIDQFLRQRSRAASRGIGWELTFPEWWGIWQKSGEYHLRGRRRNERVMARHWDAGPYAVNQVDIQRPADNLRTKFNRQRFHKVRVSGGRRSDMMPEYMKDPLQILLEEEENHLQKAG